MHNIGIIILRGGIINLRKKNKFIETVPKPQLQLIRNISGRREMNDSNELIAIADEYCKPGKIVLVDMQTTGELVRLIGLMRDALSVRVNPDKQLPRIAPLIIKDWDNVNLETAHKINELQALINKHSDILENLDK